VHLPVLAALLTLSPTLTLVHLPVLAALLTLSPTLTLVHLPVREVGVPHVEDEDDARVDPIMPCLVLE